MKARTKRILLIVAGSAVALVIVVIVSALLVLQSAWFANFAKNKIIALVDESTGGTAGVGSFQFNPWHLTVRIRNFVLHGTEPKSADPMVRVQLLEARIKLFSGWKHIAGLSYLGIEKPEVDIIVFPNGTTNIPHPRKASPPSSSNSTLQTVVDLAVDQFRLQNGLAEFADEKAAFNARGEKLRVLLNYDFAKPGYQGNVSVEPLQLASGARPPLNANVNIPIVIERDAIRVPAAQITTPESRISLTAALENINAPVISVQLNASLSLPEMQRSIDVPIDANALGAPKNVTAALTMQFNERSKIVHVQTAHIALGRTTLQASGDLNPGRNAAVSFRADLALDQLSRLLKISSMEINGNLLAQGTAKLDAQQRYSINGTLNSRGVSLRSSTVQLANVSLYSPFHADPYLISLDGLKLNALGGDLTAKIFVENMRQASVEGRLLNFSLPVLAAVFTAKHLGYGGIIDGSVKARGDLKATGMTGYSATAKLDILPGSHGVPLNGHLDLNYAGATGRLDLAHSYLALPNSRIDLSGSLNNRLDINLVSHNLNDFLPAEAFVSSKPAASLPIALHGGAANIQAAITGRLTAPQITGHVAMTKFSLQKRSFDQFAADVTASPRSVTIQNGVLAGKAAQTNFNASMELAQWRPAPRSAIKADLTVRNGDVADLLSLAGQTSIPATGQLTADVHISGMYGNPLGSATFQVLNGSAYQQPFSRLYSVIRLGDQLITVSHLELDTAGGRLTANGSFQHGRDSFMTGHAQLQIATENLQLADLEPLQKRSPGAAGTIALTANAAADLRETKSQMQFTVDSVSADLSATGLRLQNQSAGNLTAKIRTNNGTVTYNLASDFAGSNVQVNGQTSLAKNHLTTADASVRNLSIEKVLQITGQTQIPVKGNVSANAHVSGTLQAPNANLDFRVIRAEAYQERINRLEGSIVYSNTLVQIPSLKLNAPAGNITLSGSFSHQPGDFSNGSLNLKMSSSDLQFAKIAHIEQAKPGFAGNLHVDAAVSASLREHNGARQVLVSTLDADVAANELRVDNRHLGEAKFQARTQGHNLKFGFDSDIAGSQIHGSGTSQLSADYLTRANLSFSNVRYINIAPFISNATSAAPPAFDALAAGQASIDGPLLDPNRLTGRLQLNRLDVRTNPQVTPTGAPALRVVELQNQGPIIVSLSQSVLRVDQLRIAGPDTNISASGAIDLKNGDNPLGLTVAADVNLALLQDVNRDFYSSGAISLDATLRGRLTQPLVNGRIVLKNANVNYTQAPNGLSNANGIILLNGTSANIQTLTAESGGGKISIAGFVGYGPVVNFDLRANANKVRVRYSGVSVTSNASISLIGSTRRSLLRGTVSIQRIVYNSSSDAGSLLTSASAPPSTPSAPSSLLAGMRLDIHILTAPDLRVASTYANRLEIFADMTVRGTAANPGMLGRVHVTNGQLVFFGNTYTVSTGTVNFYNPNSIEPVLDISLQTVAQGVAVTIGVSGTMDDLNLSYRSDPPLTFPQIVQLLATNTTPANPVIAAHQPAPAQQSLSQMGESAILGQAIANPLASRVQRVFGLSQFKIDPSVAGNNGQPTARVTLQQKVASNITFTYITDVTETNSEIVRVEWDFTGKLSAVALRDFNGNVSLQFFYKFKKR